MALPNISFRPVTVDDCAVILHHRRGMFRDMGKGSADELDRMVASATPWVQRALAEGSYQGFVAESGDGKVVAGGGVLIHSWPPRPGDDNGRRAIIVNVFTEPEFRRMGLARLVMSLIIPSLREQGFRSVVLHASDEGRPLYESMGFVSTNEMRLCLE